jgi:hypothetical protein
MQSSFPLFFKIKQYFSFSLKVGFMDAFMLFHECNFFSYLKLILVRFSKVLLFAIPPIPPFVIWIFGNRGLCSCLGQGTNS